MKGLHVTLNANQKFSFNQNKKVTETETFITWTLKVLILIVNKNV